MLPAGDLPGGVDVLWVLSAAGAAAAAGRQDGPLSAGLGLALVLALRLAPRGLAPGAVAALGSRLGRVAGPVGHAVRALAAVGLVVALELLGGGALWWAAALVGIAEVVRPASRASGLSGGAAGRARAVAAALPPVALALLLGALGRALDAVTGVLGAPEPALVVVAGAGAGLALRARAGAGHPDVRAAPAAPPASSWADRVGALRRVVATPRGAARCAALAPVAVAAGLAPLHVLGLGGGASGAALLLLALGAGVLAGSAGASRWETASQAPGSVLTLSAGAASVLVLVVGPLTDLVLAAVVLGLAGAAAGAAVVASRRLDGAGPVATTAGREAEGGVLAVVVVLAALTAGLLGVVTFPLGSAGRLDVAGAGVVLFLVGLAGVLASLVVARPLADRVAGPLLPALLGGAAGSAGAAGRAPGDRGREARDGRHGLAGVLVALEGGDGAGKSTQAAALGRELSRRGHDVVVTREPGATPLGARVRGLLLDRGEDQPAVPPRAEALLYAADRAAHVEQVVRPALARGAVVVTDRYVDSSLAYQGAGRALPSDEVASLSRWATEGLVPDLVVVLDVDAATAAARRAGRGADDRLDAEPAAFHERVRQVFLDLARRGGDRYLVLHAGASPEELARQVLAGVEPLLPALGDEAAPGGPGEREQPPVRAGAAPAPAPVTGSADVRGPAAAPATQPVDVVGPPAAGAAPAPRPAAAAAAAGARQEAAERAEAESRQQREIEERRRAEDEERQLRERQHQEAREREDQEAREREDREAREREEQERRRVAERERREAEVRAGQEGVARERAATSFRSAEVAVAAARALGDARRPVVAAPALPSDAGVPAAAPVLPARLPEERLRQLPDAVRRAAVDVAGAQRDARMAALAAAEQERSRLRREDRRAQEEERLAAVAARERADAEREEARARGHAELMARREAEEARAEEDRRAGSRRRAETERLEEMLGRDVQASSGAHPAPRTAELPAVDEGRPALHELEAADRRRQALQRARRRAAASRRRAESEQDHGSDGGGGPHGSGGGPLADELFSWQRDDEGRPEDRG